MLRKLPEKMAKNWETLEHTADVGIAARADTARELFEALAEGMADILYARAAVRPKSARKIEVRAEDPEALAVDFLSAVLNVIQCDRFLVAAVSVQYHDVTCTIQAELSGEPYDPARHEIKTEIKAVTYHQLRVAREGRQWTGQVIFDL